jgi:cell division septum initiation protein DivIVA
MRHPYRLTDDVTQEMAEVQAENEALKEANDALKEEAHKVISPQNNYRCTHD